MRHSHLLGILILIAGFMVACSSNGEPSVPLSTIYHEGWIDLNKNGRMDPYENPNIDIEKRIDDLLGTVLWLLSPASTFVTGIVVPVDGGFSAFSGV